MSTTTCRLPDPLAKRLETAAEERGAFQSEIVRRAIRYYVAENPDEIRAFTGVFSPTRQSTRNDDEAAREAAEEVELDPSDLPEKETDVDAPDAPQPGVYDPMEDL